MRQRPSRSTTASARAVLAALMPVMLAGLMTACGGGGGGGGDAAPPPVETAARDKPLALSAANLHDAASIAVGYAGTALSVGQATVDWLASLDGARATSASGTCRNGGSFTLTLNDRDANNRPSAGDRLDVALTGCWVDGLEDVYTGMLSIDLGTPAPGAQWAGIVTAGATFGPIASGGVGVRLSGSLAFDYATTATLRTLHVGNGATPLSVIGAAGGKTATDVLTGLDVRRELDREGARNRLWLAVTASSDIVGGRVVLATTTPLASWLNAFPDAGELTVTGAAGQAARATVSTNALNFAMGAATSSEAITELLPTFAFSAKGLAEPNDNGLYALKAPFESFGLLLVPGDTVDPSGTLTWQYTKPIAATSASDLTLLPSVPSGLDAWGRGAMKLNWQVKGAWITATPAEQLAPGQGYQLSNWPSTNMVDSAATATPKAETERAPAPNWKGTARATVSAKATSSATAPLTGASAIATLDASASTAASGAPVYLWRQVSGPALAFSATDKAVVQVGPQAADSGLAVVELEVRNAAGDKDLTRLTLQVFNGGAGYLLRSKPAGAAAWTSLYAAAGGSTHVTYLPASGTLDLLIDSGRLLVGTSPANWATGRSFGLPASGSYFFIAPSRGGACLGTSTMTIQVRDFNLAANGSVDRLALDLDENCDGQHTLGELRFNTAVPATP
ncbi:hypothetical protein [Mitsuaria sp. GD03876]|uniref:hypothetical protein n=1 Tax=Mitsuaria sp. GD03876 TaxID=2975399 RepID=UPI00244A88F9|nr:hypothetical protein [Mitsuaria sp. GD03876]MDH0865732.1 hypothetical protein [Mitsuaria sp. GD03876]